MADCVPLERLRAEATAYRRGHRVQIGLRVNGVLSATERGTQ